MAAVLSPEPGAALPRRPRPRGRFAAWARIFTTPEERMKIYISGLYCGTNPQPGVGIARSLRAGYPEATLVGVEYSNRSSGLHWTDFDELWLQRPWEELSLEDYGARIGEILDSGALWV